MQFSSNYIAYNIALHANSFDSIIFIFSDVSSNLSQSYSIFHNLLSVSISQHYLLCYRAINDHLSSTTPFDNFIVCLFLKFSLHQLVSFFLFFLIFRVIPSLTHSYSPFIFSSSFWTYALYIIATFFANQLQIAAFISIPTFYIATAFIILTFTHISWYCTQLHHYCC